MGKMEADHQVRLGSAKDAFATIRDGMVILWCPNEGHYGLISEMVPFEELIRDEEVLSKFTEGLPEELALAIINYVSGGVEDE